MAGKTLPQDADEYEGAPLSLGSADPAPARGRPHDAEVARALARAVAEADDVSCQNLLDRLDGCSRDSHLPEQAGAAAAAAEMIRELLREQGDI